MQQGPSIHPTRPHFTVFFSVLPVVPADRHIDRQTDRPSFSLIRSSLSVPTSCKEITHPHFSHSCHFSLSLFPSLPLGAHPIHSKSQIDIALQAAHFFVLLSSASSCLLLCDPLLFVNKKVVNGPLHATSPILLQFLPLSA